MKKESLLSSKTKTTKALSQQELNKIFGGTAPIKSVSADSTDCTSEAATGGSTTDTYE